MDMNGYQPIVMVIVVDINEITQQMLHVSETGRLIPMYFKEWAGH